MSRPRVRLALLALVCACNERALPDSTASAGSSSTSSGTGEAASTTDPASTGTGQPPTATGEPPPGMPPSTCGDGHVDVGEVCPGEPTQIDATPVSQLWTADVDGDGRADVLTEAGLWLQRDGGFEPGVLPPLAASPGGIGDFDGDGHIDIFAYDDVARTLALSRGDGAGAFAAPVLTDVARLRGFDPVDIDGDGRTELLVQAPELDALRIYVLGDDDHFAPVMTQPMSEWMFVSSVGDGDGDGLPDLVVYESGAPTVWWGLADGTFLDSQQPLESVTGAYFADLSSDGVDELLFTHSFYPPRGPDVDAAGALWLEGAPGDWPRVQVALDGTPHVVGAGDLSSDGLPDVIVARSAQFSESALEILCTSPERSLAACASAQLDVRVEAVAAVHADADGALDLVVAAGVFGLWAIPAAP